MRSRSARVPFILLALSWGSSFFLIKLALDGMSPVQVAATRGVLGATTLALLMLLTRTRWPRSPRLWGHMLIVALAGCLIPWVVVPLGELHAPSILAGITNATTAIWAAAFMPVLIRSERLDGIRILGLGIGLLGVVVLLAPWRLTAGADLTSVLLLLTAGVGNGFALVYLRRVLRGTTESPLALVAMQISLGAAMFLLVVPFAGLSPVQLSWQVVLAILTLGVFSTGFSFLWNAQVVQRRGATLAASVNYLIPVVGVVLGIAVLGEPLHWYEPLGGAVVLVGVLVSQRAPVTAPTPRASGSARAASRRERGRTGSARRP